MKLVPVIVTTVFGWPLAGEKEEIVGAPGTGVTLTCSPGALQGLEAASLFASPE
jgi:hypothetical protein